MTTSRKQIIALIERGRLPAENIPEALRLARVYPTGSEWRAFIDSLCLWLGGLALGVSAIFFVAYNWTDIGRFAKFGLIEVLIVGGILSYCRFAGHRIIGKISLLASTLFLGALMALYHQTYQTGADPWQLFFYWALLMLPWALIGRFSALWVLWITLVNLSIVLYHQAFRGGPGIFLESEEPLLWAVFFFNTVSLSAWEYLARTRVWLRERWAIRLLAAGSGASITWLCIHAIFDDRAGPMSGVAWIAWGLLLYFVYRKLKPDLFMLACGCMSGIVVITAFLGNHILQDADAGGFLLLALIVMALGAGAAVWLRAVNRELQP